MSPFHSNIELEPTIINAPPDVVYNTLTNFSDYS